MHEYKQTNLCVPTCTEYQKTAVLNVTYFSSVLGKYFVQDALKFAGQLYTDYPLFWHVLWKNTGNCMYLLHANSQKGQKTQLAAWKTSEM